MSEWLNVAGKLLDVIIDGVRNGMSDEEVLARIAEPHGVGRELIRAVRRRRDKFADFIANG